MTSSFSLQQEICCYICIWALFVTAAMISALWTRKESPPSRQRTSSTGQTAEASAAVQRTVARQRAGDGERAGSWGDPGADRLIQTEDLRPTLPSTAAAPADFSPDQRMPLKELVAETERRAIQHALEQTGWDRTQAAHLLGITCRQVFEKIQQYGLQR